MVAVVREIVNRAATRHPAVNLLVDIGHPYHIDAKTREISLAGFLKQSLEIAAMKGRSVEPFGTIVDDSSVVNVVE